MKARKYEMGGPITPKNKEKGMTAKQKSAYELNREKKQAEQQESANSFRRQTEINKKKRQEANPEQYTKAMAVPAFYKKVEGGTQGISTAEYRKPKK